ncbi:MAG: hypothetical protein K2M95_06215 [Clostridiales bacterium]|nr:hypothetical protein [Clostridiales bacterium]
MYLLIDTMQKENVRAGDPVVVKFDRALGLVGAFGIGGESYGYLAAEQPDGCLDPWSVYARIGDNRIIARAAVVLPHGILLHSESSVLSAPVAVARVEKAGYGLCVRL